MKKKYINKKLSIFQNFVAVVVGVPWFLQSTTKWVGVGCNPWRTTFCSDLCVVNFFFLKSTSDNHWGLCLDWTGSGTTHPPPHCKVRQRCNSLISRIRTRYCHEAQEQNSYYSSSDSRICKMFEHEMYASLELKRYF